MTILALNGIGKSKGNRISVSNNLDKCPPNGHRHASGRGYFQFFVVASRTVSFIFFRQKSARVLYMGYVGSSLSDCFQMKHTARYTYELRS